MVGSLEVAQIHSCRSPGALGLRTLVTLPLQGLHPDLEPNSSSPNGVHAQRDSDYRENDTDGGVETTHRPPTCGPSHDSSGEGNGIGDGDGMIKNESSRRRKEKADTPRLRRKGGNYSHTRSSAIQSPTKATAAPFSTAAPAPPRTPASPGHW